MGIQLSEADQVRLFLQIMAILDGTNEGKPEIVRSALRALRAMFEISDENEKAANKLHHERWPGLSKNGRGAGVLAASDNQPGTEPTKTPPADISQAQPGPADTTPAETLPTARMRKALALFDGLTDSQQVILLRSVWGDNAEVQP